MPADTRRNPTPTRRLLVAGWVVDPERSSASRGEETVHIRPQLADLLFCLAARAGRTVSKEELLDAVSPDKFIAEAGVARCVGELRQLLGDDSKAPRFIQTVPKRGYRLIVPVEFADIEPSSAPPGDAASQPARREGSPDPGPDHPPLVPEVVPAGGEVRETSVLLPVPNRRPRRQALPFVLLGVAAACTVVGASVLLRAGHQPPRPAAQGRPAVQAASSQAGDELLDRTLAAAVSMESGRATLPNRFCIRVLYCQHVLQDPAAAVQAAEAWRRAEPASPLPLALLALLHSDLLGRHDLAMAEAREVASRLPDSAAASLLLGRTLLYGGRVEEARGALDEALRTGPDLQMAHLYRYQVAALQKDTETIEREVKWAAGHAGARLDFLGMQGLRALGAGQRKAAAPLMERAWDGGLAQGRRGELAADFAQYAVGLALFGDRAGAERAAGRAIELSQTPAPTAVAAVALGLAGAVDAARQADRQLEQAGANLVMVRDALRPMVAAAILLGERRPEEALRELDRLRPFETARELALLPLALRAKALLAAGRHAAAAEACRRCLDHRGLAPLSVIEPVMCFDLARALGALSDRTGSREAYRRFLTAWREADSDLPLLASARQSLVGPAGTPAFPPLPDDSLVPFLLVQTSAGHPVEHEARVRG